MRRNLDHEQANALLLEILLSQQVNAELVRRNVAELSKRIGGISAKNVFTYSDDEFTAIFSKKPAIHRFVNRMSHQTRQLFTLLEEEYDDDARNIWSPAVTASTLVNRLQQFPGIGEHKARTGLFILTREFGVSVIDDGGDYTVEGCEKLPGRYDGINKPLLCDT
ncbi:MAG TPA: hypothetical protein VF733_04390 [Candidatus Saccharimonadales bacterium]